MSPVDIELERRVIDVLWHQHVADTRTCAQLIGQLRGDLVCQFEMASAGFAPGHHTGVVRGKTRDGKYFEGRAVLTVHRSSGGRDDDDNRGRR